MSDEDDDCMELMAPTTGSAVTFTAVPAEDRPLPREFPIGFHGSDRVDPPPRPPRKRRPVIP